MYALAYVGIMALLSPNTGGESYFKDLFVGLIVSTSMHFYFSKAQSNFQRDFEIPENKSSE